MSTKGKVLIADYLHPLLAEGLQADGYVVDSLPEVTPPEAMEMIGHYTGLVVNSRLPVNRELMQKGEKLKFVCRAGSGLEVIDLPYAQSRGIHAFNSPEGNCGAVAEHALGMLLCLMNNIATANAEVKQGKWVREANRGNELSGKTVGLVAYGHTARAFAALLAGFGVKVLAYDKYVQGFSAGHVHEATLSQIADEADVLSLHLPLTAETAGMIDEEYLMSFRKPFWLLNTSRGQVLNTDGLLNCLKGGKVLGAALDVLENEKLSTLNPHQQQWFNRLVESNRVLLTPHIAGWTHESKRKIAEVLLQKIRALAII